MVAVVFRKRASGFTLIELLVVVAIVALLIAILLPSLSRAREQAKMVVCQANVYQLVVAFMTYSHDTKGRLPGSGEDPGADWLGGANPGGRQPQDGTIYRHLGKQKNVYACPSDNAPRPNNRPGDLKYSYTANTLISGANPAWVTRAHYRMDPPSPPTFLSYHPRDHRKNMKPMGVIVLVEEDPVWRLTVYPNSAWDLGDSVSNRHLNRYGTIGFIDCSVGPVNLPPTPRINGKCFTSESMCIRTAGNKWVTGLTPQLDGATFSGRSYGLLERAKPASSYGVAH